MKELAKPAEPTEKSGPDKYEIESWAKTLTDAEEIREDAEKMKLVAPLLSKKHAALSKIAGPVKSVADLKARKKAIDEAPEEEEA